MATYGLKPRALPWAMECWAFSPYLYKNLSKLFF